MTRQRSEQPAQQRRSRLWQGPGFGIWQVHQPQTVIEVVTPTRADPIVEIRVRIRASDAERLAVFLEQQVPQPRQVTGRGRSGPWRRLVDAAVAYETFFGERRFHATWSLESWFREAEASYEWWLATADDGRMLRRVQRWHMLHRSYCDGLRRTLAVSLTPDQVAFTEDYRPAGELVGYSYGITTGSSSCPALAEFLAQVLEQASPHAVAGLPAGPQERLIACLDRLVSYGHLGGETAPRQARDQMRTWWTRAGVEVRLTGLDPRHTIMETLVDVDRVFRLTLSVHHNVPKPYVLFAEWHGPADNDGDGSMFTLHVATSDLHPLVELLTQQHGYTYDPWAAVEDKLVACLERAAAAGQLGPHLPMRHSRNRLAQWCTQAGVDCQVYGHKRREQLLRHYRQQQDCVFTLGLVLDHAGNRIYFFEKWDYLGGDDREFWYDVTTPYTCLATLVDFFAARLGLDQLAGDPEDQLTACFRALVHEGHLATELPYPTNRDRVAALLAEAGVPVETGKGAY